MFTQLLNRIINKFYYFKEYLWNISPYWIHYLDREINKFRFKYNIYIPFSKNKGIRYFPREISWVDPQKIEYYDKIRLFSNIYYIQNGNWDLHVDKINNKVQYRVVDELITKLIPIEKLTDFEFTVHKIMNASRITREDAEKNAYKKYKRVEKLIKIIKNSGYKTQQELGNISKNKYNTWYDEIRVSITRDGKYILNGSGNHRLCIAKQLGLKKIPVVVIRKHYLFLKAKKKTYST